MTYTTRQIEILDIALQIISKEGIQNFTMKQVAAEIGVSEPAIYRHFANKVAILDAVLEQFSQRQQELAAQYLDGKEFANVGRFMQAVLKLLAEKPALSAIIFSEELFQSEPTLKEKVAEIMLRTQTAMIAHLSRVPMARFLPIEHTAWMFLGSMRFLVARWRMSNFGFNLESEGKSFMKNLMKIPAHTERQAGKK